jgi:hypothetical protein
MTFISPLAQSPSIYRKHSRADQKEDSFVESATCFFIPTSSLIAAAANLASRSCSTLLPSSVNSPPLERIRTGPPIFLVLGQSPEVAKSGLPLRSMSSLRWIFLRGRGPTKIWLAAAQARSRYQRPYFFRVDLELTNYLVEKRVGCC